MKWLCFPECYFPLLQVAFFLHCFSVASIVGLIMFDWVLLKLSLTFRSFEIPSAFASRTRCDWGEDTSPSFANCAIKKMSPWMIFLSQSLQNEPASSQLLHSRQLLDQVEVSRIPRAKDSGVFFPSATVWTMEFEFGGGIPLSFHNLWVSILMLLMSAWLLQVAYRIFKAHRIQWRMRRSEMGPLFLDGLSLYTTDLQEIIRQHFNQLLRIRPTVPARDIAKVKILAHLQPESLKCSKVVEVDTSMVVTKLRLVFKVDSLQPFKVQLFWGQRCHDLLRQLADDVDVDVNWNERKQLPAGNGQEVTIGVAMRTENFLYRCFGNPPYVLHCLIPRILAISLGCRINCL